MDAFFSIGSLILGVYLVAFGVRIGREGGRVILPMGLAFIVPWVSKMLEPRLPGARIAGLAITAMLAVYTVVVCGREARKAMRTELWLGIALVAALAVLVFVDSTSSEGNLVALAVVALLGAAFIGVTLVRLFLSERSIHRARKPQ